MEAKEAKRYADTVQSSYGQGAHRALTYGVFGGTLGIHIVCTAHTRMHRALTHGVFGGTLGMVAPVHVSMYILYVHTIRTYYMYTVFGGSLGMFGRGALSYTRAYAYIHGHMHVDVHMHADIHMHIHLCTGMVGQSAVVLVLWYGGTLALKGGPHFDAGT